MKKTAILIIVTAMLATSSQAFGQLSGGNDGEVQLPAVQQARDAFEASLYAYQYAQYKAHYWQWMNGRRQHPNAAIAAMYWQLSANYQYQAMVRLYSVWKGIENRGYIMPIDRQLALEAKEYSLDAGWFAMAGASYVDPWLWNDPAVVAAEDAYDKIELLIPDLGQP